MVIKIVEKDEEYFTIGDLIEDIKKSQRSWSYLQF